MNAARVEISLLIAFADLTRFTVNSARRTDAEVATVIDGWYERVGARLLPAGGRIVKFIGDATLAVFEEGNADAAVTALLSMRRDAAQHFASHGWDSQLVVKLHCGTVIAGPYGAAGDKSYDVLGTAVNVAARLPSAGFAMSPEVFRKLSAPARKAFKKHTPPVTYIPLDDPRP